ncbi:MAG: TMEM165/GDT1 family protein [Chloroflexi bacterium]|nr:TMEM165/GDT1 family protein [Chloroflexota bacterium]MDA8188846.1 TMEM165/GDT1 family protein [Dehalococcoidales bacterium]
MGAFWYSLFFITAAEIGDKTQLVSLAFAARYSARIVLAGVFIATLVVHLFSVAVGELLGLSLPTFWINAAAGAAFVGFGVWTLRGDKLDAEDSGSRFANLGPFFTVAATFFMAELGDKTQLATVTIASRELDFVGVWLGSTLGMVLADGLAILLGVCFGRCLPQRAIRLGAAAIFLVFGVWTLVQMVAPGMAIETALASFK